VSVFDRLVGQQHVVEVLTSVISTGSEAMSHAWLLTGPAGSGRSVAARAFAAALQCADGGCGHCNDCTTVLAGTHPDLELVTPAGLSYSVAETRELITRAALAPTHGRWQVVVVEDADRLTEQAQNALLKSIEEPPPRTVWLLCTPSTEDLLPTIRSRCRLLTLRIPTAAAIADHLVAEGVDRATAMFAARAAQGHVGRARRLARDEGSRSRRREVLAIPTQVASVPACFSCAANLVEAAAEDAATITDALDTAERAERDAAVTVTGSIGKGRATSRRIGAAGAELERRQRSRATRARRDALDGALIDLASFYRDVLVAQLAAPVAPINVDLEPVVRRLAEHSTPEATVRWIQAILTCREAIDTNVAPLLAVESMTLALHRASVPAREG
jgi:DNA polymerase-3 subunit delta'